mmetsp:Transcript_14616/g.31135  ORF Transcript_14616/g.31135 Transcript_14616/m.31135 type:complete len:133 (+) Transcript_14616:1731-2129(+)
MQMQMQMHVRLEGVLWTRDSAHNPNRKCTCRRSSSGCHCSEWPSTDGKCEMKIVRSKIVTRRRFRIGSQDHTNDDVWNKDADFFRLWISNRLFLSRSKFLAWLIVVNARIVPYRTVPYARNKRKGIVCDRTM